MHLPFVDVYEAAVLNLCLFCFSAPHSRWMRSVLLVKTEENIAIEIRSAYIDLVYTDHNITVSFYVLYEQTVAEYYGNAFW